MNLPSIIILVLIAVWFVFSIVYMRKHRNINGCSGCTGDCSQCRSGCSSNLKIDTKNNK